MTKKKVKKKKKKKVVICGHEHCVSVAFVTVDDPKRKRGYDVCPFHLASVVAQILSDEEDDDAIRENECIVTALNVDSVRMMGDFQWEDDDYSVIHGWNYE